MIKKGEAMSLPVQVKNLCYLCGKISDQMVLASTSQFGAPDLDLRPPEMERSSMELWFQECPHCGYISKDIYDKTTVTKEWLKSETYLSCDNRSFKAKLAEKFYKQYMTKIKDENYKYAFFAVHYAAWVSDDAQDTDNAIYCRKKALEALEKFVVDQDQKETFLLIKADLLRRTGQFDLLIAEYKEKTFSEELLNKIVAFQIEKAKQKDTSCYTVADVMRKYRLSY